jgi:hypothetical protein
MELNFGVGHLVLVLVVRAIVFVRAGQLFEVVRVLNGRGDLVLSACPFAEIEDATAVRTKGEVLVGGEDYFAAGGAKERF